MAADLAAGDARVPLGEEPAEDMDVQGFVQPGPTAMQPSQQPPAAEAPGPAPRRPPLPPGVGPPASPAALPAAAAAAAAAAATPSSALEALERRVATALRAMQARHESSLDEAVQVLVGQLWAAYFSIGSLQAHQQALQAQLQQVLLAQNRGGAGPAAAAPPGFDFPALAMAAAALRGNAVEAQAEGARQPTGDSLAEESSSVTLSELAGDAEVECCGCQQGGGSALPPAPAPRKRKAGGAQQAKQAGLGADSGSRGSFATRSGGGGGGRAAAAAGGAPAKGDPKGKDSDGEEGEGAGGHKAKKHPRSWSQALKKERSKRRRLEREVRELRGLLEQLIPGVLDSAAQGGSGGAASPGGGSD